MVLGYLALGPLAQKDLNKGKRSIKDTSILTK